MGREIISFISISFERFLYGWLGIDAAQLFIALLTAITVTGLVLDISL